MFVKIPEVVSFFNKSNNFSQLVLDQKPKFELVFLPYLCYTIFQKDENMSFNVGYDGSSF